MTTYMDIEYLDGHTRHFRIHHINISDRRVLHIIGEGYPGECERHFVPLDVIRSWSFRTVNEDPKPTMPMGIMVSPPRMPKVGDLVDVNIETGKVTGVSFVTDRLTSGAPVTGPLNLKPSGIKVMPLEEAQAKYKLPPGKYLGVRPHVTMEGTCIACYSPLSYNPGCITMQDGSTVHAVPQ